MPVVILIGVIFFFVVLGSVAGGGASRRRLIANGVPARGLVLSAAPSATEASFGGQRFEVRQLVLDVEVPGEEPYEVAVSPFIPRICDAVPGAALELRVDPKSRGSVAIVGPPGASDWLGAAPVGLNLSTTGRKGCAGPIVAVVIAISLGVFAFAASDDHPKENSSRERPAKEQRAIPAKPTRPAKPAKAVSRAACEAATRCCTAMGAPDCDRFGTIDAQMCEAALKEEKMVADLMGKSCP